MTSAMEALVLRLRDAQAEATGAIQTQAQKLIQLKEDIEAAANETYRVKVRQVCQYNWLILYKQLPLILFFSMLSIASEIVIPLL